MTLNHLARCVSDAVHSNEVFYDWIHLSNLIMHQLAMPEQINFQSHNATGLGMLCIKMNKIYGDANPVASISVNKYLKSAALLPWVMV
jgi:hypothetical protein